MTAAGGRPLPISVDVSDPAAVDAAATRVEQELGPIDVWVNAAFTTVFAPVQEVEAEEFERVTRVAYLGFVHGTQAALRRMVPRDRGAIVQVGSALAHRGIPLQAAYCAGTAAGAAVCALAVRRARRASVSRSRSARSARMVRTRFLPSARAS